MQSRIGVALSLYAFGALGLFLLVAPWTPAWMQATFALLPAAAQEAASETSSVVEVPAPPALVPGPVDLALCLDTSGSMDGLIESAKQKLWAIVNDMALAISSPE